MARVIGELGVTMLELIVVVAVIGLAIGVAALNLQPLESPLNTGTTLTESFMRQARLSAIASTSAYRVSPAPWGGLLAESGSACGASTWTPDPRMNLELPNGVTFESTAWSVCYSSRGLSADNVSLTLQHDTAGSVDIEVLLGGTTRVVP